MPRDRSKSKSVLPPRPEVVSSLRQVLEPLRLCRRHQRTCLIDI